MKWKFHCLTYEAARPLPAYAQRPTEEEQKNTKTMTTFDVASGHAQTKARSAKRKSYTQNKTEKKRIKNTHTHTQTKKCWACWLGRRLKMWVWPSIRWATYLHICPYFCFAELSQSCTELSWAELNWSEWNDMKRNGTERNLARFGSARTQLKWPAKMGGAGAKLVSVAHLCGH